MAKRIVVEFAGETRGLDQAFARVRQSTDGIDKAFKGLIASAAIGVVVDQLGDAVRAASDLTEAMNKSAVVFGNHAGQVDIWARSAAESFGLSRQEAIESAATFGNMFDAMGIGVQSSMQMSQSIVELGADLASFNNIGIPEVLERLRSGLLGEQEAVERLGINMSETRLKAKALEMGIGDGKKVLDATTKAQAAYAIILEDTTNAQGDFARTSGSLANQQRILDARIKDLRATIGEDLLPVMNDAAGFAINTLVPNFEAFLGIGTEFDSFGAHFRDAIGDMIGFVLGALQQGARGIANVFSALPTDIGEGVADDLRTAADGMDKYRDRLHATGQELFGVANAEKALRAGIDATISAVLGETDARGKGTAATEKTAEAIEKEAAARIKLKDAQFDIRSSELALEQSTRDLAEAQDAYNEFLRTGGIDIDRVKQAQEELIGVQKDVERATLDVADAQKAVNEALKPATHKERLDSSHEQARAQNDLTIAQLDAKDAQKAYTDLVTSGKASQEELTRAWVRSDEALRSVKDAEDRLAETQQTANDLAQKGTTNTQAYKDAVQVLNEKQAALKDATDKQTAAQAALTTAQALGKDHADKLWEVTNRLKEAELDLEQKTWGAEKAQIALKDATVAVTTGVRTAWANVNGYTDALNKIPAEKKTKITYEEIYAIPTGTSDINAENYAKYLKSVPANADPVPYDMWARRHARAAGGPVTAGQAYLVGEVGPELFVPSKSGTIVPNGAGVNVNVVVNGWVGNDVELTRKIISAINAEASRSGRVFVGAAR